MRRGRHLLLGALTVAGLCGLVNAGSLVASAQRGTIALAGAVSNTATIATVRTDCAFVAWGGTSSSNAAVDTSWARVTLTNATTVTANLGAAGTVNVTFHVLELRPGVVRSVQSGTINNTNTASISEVNPATSWLIYRGQTVNVATDERSSQRSTLTNGTTVTGTIVGAGGGETTIGGFTVVEFA